MHHTAEGKTKVCHNEESSIRNYIPSAYFGVTRTYSATAVAAAVANGGVGMIDPGGEPRIPNPTDLLSILSSAMAPGSSMGVRSFTEMVAASVGAGFAAGRGARRAAQRAAATGAVPATRETPSSSVGFGPSAMLEIPVPGRLPSPQSFEMAPSG